MKIQIQLKSLEDMDTDPKITARHNKQQHQSHRNNRPVKCNHCKKPGHLVEKCFVKFPALRAQNQNGQRDNPTNHQPKTK